MIEIDLGSRHCIRVDGDVAGNVAASSWCAGDPDSDRHASVARVRLHKYAQRLSVVGTPSAGGTAQKTRSAVICSSFAVAAAIL